MSKFLKIFSIIFAVFLFGFFAFKFFQTAKQPTQSTLIVGLQSGYPPFEFMDSKGNIVGFDVDVANRIASKLNKKLIIKDMDFEGEILSLKQGKIDLIISGMNITHSRLKEIQMVPYHGEAADSLSLIFWEKIPEGVLTLQDIAKLPNPIISVESGAIPEEYLKGYPEIDAKALQGALAPLMDVKYGKSVANLVEKDVAEYLQSKHQEIKILEIPLEKGEEILGFGIGIKKGNGEFFQQVFQIIQELKDTGELKQLEEKWFRGDQ